MQPVVQAASGVGGGGGEQHGKRGYAGFAGSAVSAGATRPVHLLLGVVALRLVGGQRAAIVKLQAAPTAMVELSAAREPLHQVQKALVKAVDAVGRSEFGYPVGAANRAAAGGAEVVPVAARHELLAVALRTFIDRHITEAFQESPVNAAKSAAALPALHCHGLVYNAICVAGTTRATILRVNPPNREPHLCWTGFPCMARASTTSEISTSRSRATPLPSLPA